MRNATPVFVAIYQMAATLVVCLFCAVTAALALPAATPAESRLALVIGNGGYARAELANPPRDARLLAETLSTVGFDVIRVIDGDRKTMQDALVTFARRLAATDSVGLFYYAGHGVQVNGVNYLLPVDVDVRAETEVLLQGLNLDEILATMNPATTRLAVAVLDACRNNPFVTTTRGLSRGLAPVQAPAGTLIAFSTAPGEVALDGTGLNSPYSAALAREIPSPGLPIEEVFKRTRQAVMRATGNAQVPWEHSSLIGQFEFAPKPMPGADERDTFDGPTTLRLAELAAWEAINQSKREQDYHAFIQKYPSGDFAELARYRIDRLAGPPAKSWSWWLPKVVAAARPAGGGEQAEELYERALRLEAGKPSPDAIRVALGLYKTAAGAGLTPALYRFARLTEREARRKRRSGGTRLDYEHELEVAAKAYTEAAEKDHAAAQHALGTLHEFGEGVGRNLAEALRLYNASAAAGDAGGMTSLAYLYATGKGVKKAPHTARQWYEKAARAGSERAMFNLAIMLMSGDGGHADVAGAARWLRTAADHGHAGAMRQLAVLLDQGQGIGRDTTLAAVHLLKAYAAGDSSAKADLFENSRRWSRATRRAIQRQLQLDGAYAGPIHGVINATTQKALTRYASQR